MGKICKFCDHDGHLTNECTMMHFVPDKEKVILKYNFKLNNNK